MNRLPAAIVLAAIVLGIAGVFGSLIVVSAESEDAAIDLMTDPGDGSYWEVIDTNDPSVTRLNGGKA